MQLTLSMGPESSSWSCSGLALKSIMVEGADVPLTSLLFLRNLRIGPISQSAYHWQAFSRLLLCNTLAYWADA
jgi:hypothetical protein